MPLKGENIVRAWRKKRVSLHQNDVLYLLLLNQTVIDNVRRLKPSGDIGRLFVPIMAFWVVT
jgi:hypothetical protein